MPKLYIASDHAGYELKRELIERLRALGWEIQDLGPFAFDAEDDYPDFIVPLARRVAGEPDSFGIVIGGSGQGEAMAANRVPGARAALFYGPTRTSASYDIVGLAREHNNANILSLGARFVTVPEAEEAVRIFIDTPFSGGERHSRRLAKF